MRTPVCLLLIAVLSLADAGSELLAAARKGQIDRLRALTTKRISLEPRDKNGRTPLMLAAQHGHAEAVRLLLEKGASTEARDKDGYNAYALTLLSSSDAREAVLKLLPKPRVVHVVLQAELAPDNLYGSCFLSPAQLGKHMSELRPEATVLAAVRQTAANPGIGPELVPVEFVQDGGDATAVLRVRPQVSCVQSADNISLAIDVRLDIDGKRVLDKTFGGGFKGLHAVAATSPTQYLPMFNDWARNHAAEIYWALVGSTMRS